MEQLARFWLSVLASSPALGVSPDHGSISGQRKYRSIELPCLHMREDSRTIPGRLGEWKVAGKRACVGDEIHGDTPVQIGGIIQELLFPFGGTTRRWADTGSTDGRQEAQNEGSARGRVEAVATIRSIIDHTGAPFL